MNYYRRYVGDYLRDTARLSILEHGAYNLLLDYYYAEERPIPLGLDEVYRMVRALMPEERRAIQKVLSTFFTKGPDGWRHKRVDAEIATAQACIAKQRASGVESAAKRWSRHESSDGSTHDAPIQPPTTNLQPPTASHQPPLKPVVGLAPDKRREARDAAERAITYLNQRAGTRFRPTEANVKLPAARILYDKASEADLRAVVDVKVAEASRGEFDRKYLRPATLWNAEKFSQYIGQISTGTATARSRVCAYCQKPETGSVNGIYHCDEHSRDAMDSKPRIKVAA